MYKLVNKESEYRTTAYTQSVLDHMKKKLKKLNGTIEELPFDTNWKELL